MARARVRLRYQVVGGPGGAWDGELLEDSVYLSDSLTQLESFLITRLSRLRAIYGPVTLESQLVCEWVPTRTQQVPRRLA